MEVTHRSLFDNTIQGISYENGKVFGFQGHPEASPGPQDIRKLFDKFLTMTFIFKMSKICQTTIIEEAHKHLSKNAIARRKAVEQK